MNEEELDKKEYSFFCIASFVCIVEILLLILMDALNFIEITETGLALYLNICIVSFIFGLIGLIGKSRGKWMGIVGTTFSIGLFFFLFGLEKFLSIEISVGLILLIIVLFKKLINRKNKE